jgi:hypothetical protein
LWAVTPVNRQTIANIRTNSFWRRPISIIIESVEFAPRFILPLAVTDSGSGRECGRDRGEERERFGKAGGGGVSGRWEWGPLSGVMELSSIGVSCQMVQD